MTRIDSITELIISRLGRGVGLAVGVCLVLAVSVVVQADQLVAPILIGTSDADGPTLGIPRWKGYMSDSDPDKFWAGFAGDGGSDNNMRYTADGGDTWSTNTITIDGYLDFHLSATGQNDNLYFTSPGTAAIIFRKFSAPATTSDDGGPLINLTGTTPQHRSNIMVQPDGRLWIFTRRGGSSSENVRYFYSDNDGSGWVGGMAVNTNAPDVRIGSMPVIDGRPALIVLHLNDQRGYEYYLWNGVGFEAPVDHSIYAADMGYVRDFTHNVINGSTMHLVFGRGTQLIHVWKEQLGAAGQWNVQTIETSSVTLDNEWYPITTVRGNELFLFYCRKSTSLAASSMIYYRKWSQVTQSWSQSELVSTASGNVANRDPNTCFQVPANADYVPVFWWCAGAPNDIYFAKVTLTVDEDLIPPGKVNDLGGQSSAPGTR